MGGQKLNKAYIIASIVLAVFMIAGQVDNPNLNYQKNFNRAVSENNLEEMVHIGSVWYTNCKRIDEPDVVITIASNFIKKNTQNKYAYKILDRTLKRFRLNPDKYNKQLCVGEELEDYRLNIIHQLISLKLDVSTQLNDHNKYLESLRQIQAIESQLVIG
jgi:hypothetical protein